MFGQSEEQLWRGAPPTVGRRGRQPHAMVPEMLQYLRGWLYEDEVASDPKRRPDNVSEAMWAAYLQILRNVRLKVARQAADFVHSAKTTVRMLNGTRDRATAGQAVGLKELTQLEAEAKVRATIGWEKKIGAMDRKWFVEAQMMG